MVKYQKHFKLRLVLILFPVVSAISFYSSFGSAASVCGKLFPSNTRPPHNTQPSKLYAWDYMGQPDFRKALVTIAENNHPTRAVRVEMGWSPEPLGFDRRLSGSLQDHSIYYIDPAQAELAQNPGINSLLDANEAFTFDLFRKIGYVSESGISELQNQSKTLDPSQIVFYELIHQLPQAEANKTFPRSLPPHRRTPYSRSGSLVEVKLAAGFLVRGQIGARKMSIPADLNHPIDRQKFPHIWEVGRAAQISESSFQIVLLQALQQAVREALIAGFDLNDCHIFSYGLDSSHIKLYTGPSYGMTVLPMPDGPPKLVVKLTTLLETVMKKPAENLIVEIRKDILNLKMQVLYLEDSNGNFMQVRDMARRQHRFFEIRDAQFTAHSFPSEHYFHFSSKDQSRMYTSYVEDSQSLESFLSRNQSYEVLGDPRMPNEKVDDLLLTTYHELVKNLIQLGLTESDAMQRLEENRNLAVTVESNWSGRAGTSSGIFQVLDWQQLEFLERRGMPRFPYNFRSIVSPYFQRYTEVYSMKSIGEVYRSRTDREFLKAWGQTPKTLLELQSHLQLTDPDN